MSSYLIKQFIKGIALRGESTDILDETVEGSLFHNSTQQKIKSYIEGAVREVVTNSQIQTLTNKTIVAANNSIVVASTNTNLSSTELNNALTELQNDIDSNSGNLASHIAAADPHSQYETSVEAQAKVDAHANRTDNPHSVTKAQVGLGNVDNTNDANKPVSIATQSALDAKENLTNKSTDVLLGTSDSLYPTQNAVKNYVDSSISSAATPDATDLIKGKIKLAGDLAGTADVPTVPGLATKEPSITAGTTSQYFRGDKTFQTLDKNAVGLSNVDNTSDANKPVSIATQSALDLKLNSSQVGVANGAASLDATGKVPSSQLPSYVDDVLEFSDLGAFPAGETGKIYVALDTGKCYRFSGSIYVEISPSEVISVAGKTGAVLLTKSDVGLSNVDNTSDLNKPISTATQTALNLKANSADVYTKIESDANFEPKNANIQTHISSTSNPHNVTASQVGLGNVDNTSDLNKPISTATQNALDTKANVSHTHISTDITDFSESVDDRVNTLIIAGSNISKNYDDLANTLTISASVVTDHTALTNIGTNSHASIDSHISSTSNPHSVTKSQVGLGNVDNTSDANKPISIATQTALAGKYDVSNPAGYVNAAGAAAAAPVQSVAGKTGPVLLDKSDVGLSNVDNTSDLNKPISTATQTALSGKANTSHTHISADITDFNESVDDRISSTIVAGTNVTVAYDDNANTLTISAAGGGGGSTTLDGLTDVSVPSPSNGQALVYNTATSQWEAQTISSGGGGSTDLDGLTDVTLASVLDNQILRYDLASTQWKNETLLKDDIGLSNVDNTSDASKPVSTATQTALNAKVNKAGDRMEGDLEFGINSYVTYTIEDISDPSFVPGDIVEIYRYQVVQEGAPYNRFPNEEVLIGTITVNSSGVIPGPNPPLMNESTIETRIKQHLNTTNTPYEFDSNTSTLTYDYGPEIYHSYGYPSFFFQIKVPSRNYTYIGGSLPSSYVVHNQAFALELGNPVKIENLKAGVHSYDAVNKQQLDNIDNLKLSKTGDSMTGVLNIGTPIQIEYFGYTQSVPPSATVDVHLTDLSNTYPDIFVGTITDINNGNISAAQVVNTLRSYFDLNNIKYKINDLSLDLNILTTQPSIIYEQDYIPESRYYVPKINGIASLPSSYTLIPASYHQIKRLADGVRPNDAVNKSQLDTKANSIHTHVSADITDFNESVDDRVSSLLVAGSNITLTYDDNANTLSIAAAGSAPSTSSEKLVTNVFNDSGATIPKMSAVYINGSQGDQAKIVLAQANTEATSSKTYGLVQSDILATESGVVVEQGRLENLDTDIVGWNEGDVLWLSSTIAGGITNVKPSAPNHAVFIGYLIKKHHSVGVIQVSIQNGYEIQELHNVAVTSIADGQVLKYESATSLWKNHTLTKSDVGLSNVDNTSDASKPVSTATQTALDAKVNKAGDTMTGNLKMGAPILVTYAPPTYSGLFPLEVVDIYIAEPNTVLPDVLIGSAFADSSGNILPSQIITVFENYFIANSIVYELPATINPTIIYEQRNTPETAYYLPKISGTIDTINTSVSFAVPPNQIKELANGTSPKDAVNKSQLDTKQDTLVSGTNIKTVNGESLLGLGDIVISGGGSTTLDGLTDVSTPSPTNGQALVYNNSTSLWEASTLNKTSVGLSNVDNTSDISKPISTATQSALDLKQNTLVSSTNIKTINGSSILGSGDLVITAPANSVALIPALNIDWNSAGVLYKDISASSTFTFSNVSEGKSISVILGNTSASPITITFPSGIYKELGTISIAANSTTICSFVRANSRTYLASLKDLTNT